MGAFAWHQFQPENICDPNPLPAPHLRYSHPFLPAPTKQNIHLPSIMSLKGIEEFPTMPLSKVRRIVSPQLRCILTAIGGIDDNLH
jgi:hypothetical protein